MKCRCLFFILLFPSLLSAQTQLYLNAIAGQYMMTDMKQFQDDLIKQYNAAGIAVKRELDFASSMQIEVGVDNIIDTDNSYMIGGFFNHGITKGQIGYSDYSGEINAVQNLKRYIIGVKTSYGLGYGFNFYGKAGYSYNTLDLVFSTNIINYPSQSSFRDDKFHSSGFILEPGIGWVYNVKQFFFRVQAGYEVNIQGKTIYDTDSNLYLLKNSNEKAIINWSGFRFGVGFGYTLLQ